MKRKGRWYGEEMDGPSVEEEVCPAFVTDPVSMMYGQQEIQKERKRSMNHTVYLKLSQITELTHKDVVLKDVAQVYCDDQNVMNKCNSMKVMTVKVDAKRRYIMSALDIINKLKQLDSTIDVNNVGRRISL